MLVLLAISILSVALKIQTIKAEGDVTITINADGSITPPWGLIKTVDNITYTFTGNISYPIWNGIVVERSNIVIDGSGYTVQGNRNGLSVNALTTGINITGGLSNVTIRNADVEGFGFGIYLGLYSSGGTVVGNYVTANINGIWLAGSNGNTISGNQATANGWGIGLGESFLNTVTGNDVTANIDYGIVFGAFSNNNTVSGNSATANGDGIALGVGSNYNRISGNDVSANSVGIFEWCFI